MTGVADDPPADDPPAGGLPAQGHPVVLVALSVPALTATLDARGDRYVLSGNGEVGGRWGPALIHFQLAGQRHEILHARVVTERRLPAGRRAFAYRFCNAWNHDKLLPAAYVHEVTDDGLVIVGEVTVDLEHGVSPGQLEVLVNTIVTAGMLLATAVENLPDDDPLA